MHPTTPRKITGSIRRFVASLGQIGTPADLPFLARSDDYLPSYCLSNCEAECRRTQVEIVFGWVIWEFRKNSFIEAEFHSVVRQNGILHDITPRKDGEERVLFVPDLTRVAFRENERTWRTWTNHKKQGATYAPTVQITLEDAKSNVWV